MFYQRWINVPNDLSVLSFYSWKESEFTAPKPQISQYKFEIWGKKEHISFIYFFQVNMLSSKMFTCYITKCFWWPLYYFDVIIYNREFMHVITVIRDDTILIFNLSSFNRFSSYSLKRYVFINISMVLHYSKKKLILIF